MNNTLKIKTGKRTGPVPTVELPFLACEFKDGAGEVYREDFSSLARHVLMHRDHKNFYTIKDALKYSDADLFQILPQKHQHLHRIFFKNKFALTEWDVSQYYCLSGEKMRTALGLGWQETCRQMKEHTDLFFDDY
jgi:hypothetical protein